MLLSFLIVFVIYLVVQVLWLFLDLKTLQVVSWHILGQSGKFFYVCKKFEEIYWAVTFPVSFEDFSNEFVETNCRFEFSSKKHPSLKKKNCSNRSSDGGDIAEMKFNYLLRVFVTTVSIVDLVFFQSGHNLILFAKVDVRWSFQFRKGIIIRILSWIDWVRVLTKFSPLRILGPSILQGG